MEEYHPSQRWLNMLWSKIKAKAEESEKGEEQRTDGFGRYRGGVLKRVEVVKWMGGGER